LVPNGIEALRSKDGDEPLISPFQPEDTDKFKVVYPALFIKGKGHIPFLQALAERDNQDLNATVIYLCGDGPEGKRAKEIVERYGLQGIVRMPGFVTNLDAYLSACDLVILPSLNEAFGYVLLEAMQYGKPVLGADVGGIREIILHGRNGEVAAVDDMSAFIGRIGCLSRDGGTLARYGQAALTDWARFDVSSMVNHVEAIYTDLIDKPSARSSPIQGG